MFNIKGVNKLLCIYLMEYYQAIKNDGNEALHIDMENSYLVLLREKKRNKISGCSIPFRKYA